MKELFDMLDKAGQASALLSNQVGRVSSLTWGIVNNIDDPDKLGRIKVLLPAKGSRYETDWLMRIQPFHLLSTPLPSLGQTVLVAFIGDDPHKGCYIGTTHNLQNPVDEPESIRLDLGEILLTITPTSFTVVCGNTEILQTEDNIKLSSGTSSVDISSDGVAVAASSFTINGKDVLAIGSKDNRGHSAVTKGY